MNRISYAERVQIYRTAIYAWGAENQEKMVVEEMSELTKEICKHWRGRDNLDAIADEIADVTIMLEQLRLIYGGKETDAWIDRKLERLWKMMRLPERSRP
jgi:NTP pyrophosphatase (non-canonical NTP hydrolase)